MSILKKILPEKKEKPANWDAFSKPADVWNGVSETIDEKTGLTPSQKAEKDVAEKVEKAAAEKEAARLQKIADDAQLLKDEETRPAREAAEKIRREVAEEARLRDREQALTVENEQRIDKERRAEYALKDKEGEARKTQADITAAQEKEREKQWTKGALMRSFAASAERVFKVTLPIAGTLLLLAAVVFGVRLATMPIDGMRNNGDAAAPKDGGKGNKPDQPNDPPPVDDNGGTKDPHGSKDPDDPDPTKWGWDKYFKPDGQPINPPQTVNPSAPRR